MEWARAAVTLGVLGLYLIVTGGSVSVTRAFAMAALVIVGRAWERPADTLNTLGAAILVLLALRPSALFEVGFQLSVGAVAALVTLVPILTAAVLEWGRRTTARSFVTGSLVASVAATLGTAPALLVHFGAAPLGGLVLNLPAIPLTALTLAGGLGVAAFSGWAPLLADGFALFATAGARGLEWVSTLGASGLGWAAVRGYWESPLVLIASVAGLASIALWRRPTVRNRLALAAGTALVAAVWTFVATGRARPAFDVVFLDVGQGDATILALPNGEHVLIDAGLRSPYVDEGERTVVPHLERYGIDRLAALVLTHADADHIGGAQAVMEAIPVGRLVTNGQDGESDLWAATLQTADSLAVPVVSVAAGDTLAVDPSVRLRVLGPTSEAPPGDANDASVVLLAEHGQTRWLFPGDAESGAERGLLARYARALDVDVVKVGHHGSRTSSTAGLVAAVGEPSFAVVSVARRNRYGLPNAEPLARWDRAGAQTLLTSAEGAVWLRSDGGAVSRVAWR